MKRTQTLITVIIAMIAFTACKEQFFYEETIKLSEENWTYQDSLQFVVDIKDTTQRYDLYLDFVHTTDYPFQNIYTKINTQYPSQKRIGRQVNIDLADQTGKWYGNCNGNKCQLRVALQQNTFFNEIGQHTITLQQFTRRKDLQGILSIAFKVKKLSE